MKKTLRRTLENDALLIRNAYDFVIADAGISPSELQTRKFNVVMIKHCAFVALRDYASTTLIGKVSGRDHATIVHAAKQHGGRLKYETKYKEVYQHVKTLVDTFMEGNGVELEESPFVIHQLQLAEMIERHSELIQTIKEKEDLIIDLKKRLNDLAEFAGNH